MNVDGSMVTVAVAVFGVGGTWAVMGYRVRQLETERKAAATAAAELSKRVEDLNSTLEHVRQSQGGRLGAVEDKISDLRGRVEGFAAGFGAGRRSRTAAGGVPVPGSPGA